MQTIVEIFVATAQKYPDHIAVKYCIDNDWHGITYAELLVEARHTAAYLASIGVGSGDPVILMSQRSPQLCSNLLGILWVGAHYVFVDGNYPLERQQFICSEVGATVGLCDSTIPTANNLNIQWHSTPITEKSLGSDQSLGSNPSLNLQIKVSTDAELPAYIIFTSGSTGAPKGVVVPHRGVTRLVCETDYIDFNSKEVFFQLSALSFDLSTLELWGPLLNGGVCVLHSEIEVLTPAGIRNSIESQHITTLWLTTSLYNAIISDHSESLAGVKQLIIGGEALSVSHIRKGLVALPNTAFYNGYGPTENTTFSTVYPIPKKLPKGIKRIPIGYPIKGTTCDIFDEQLKPASGEGELIVFGDGVATQYLNRPELSAERFVDIACRDGDIRKGYRTGDLVTVLDDGSYDYLQRNDKQIKIDGHRIEPGEIELVINELPDIVEARVFVKLGPRGQKRLTAYVVTRNEASKEELKSGLNRQAIREQLAVKLPDFMLPHFIIPMALLPKNKNGKLDESKLPDPFYSKDKTKDSNKDPTRNSKMDLASSHKAIANCWETILGRQVAADDNFLDVGGTSLESVQLAEALEKVFSITLKSTFVFEYPSVQTQLRFFLESSEKEKRYLSSASASASTTTVDCAVIGMACRFPGAKNAKEFWDNLVAGKETIRFFNEDEISSEVDQEERHHKHYVRAKGVVDDSDKFDAKFFGISPVEADVMDPQHRVMLEMAWHALEDAGYPPGDADADQGDKGLRTGVFAGANWPRYFHQYVLPNKSLLKRYGAFNASLANEADFLTTRISYQLNLKGPSVNVYSACSTGLVAVSQACASIERGDCEMAIAGGVSITTPLQSGYLYQEGGMFSVDGHCRPFDAKATGTTFNDGAGMVVLKRLDLAQRDGDQIYAVVKGHAVNNDGEQKASFTAPSVGGQVDVYNAALARSGFEPSSVGFIETHGTATPLGDPIEIEALRQSYAVNSGTKKTCAIGSVKSNIGHAIHAAGIASFIKAVLSVQRGQIPATLFFQTANPKLELGKTPFYVNNTLKPWLSDAPRRAAITSLGVGGTNAHVLIEQAKDAEKSELSSEPFSVLVSAKSKESLAIQLDRYSEFLKDINLEENVEKEENFEQCEKSEIAKIAYTSALGRKHFSYRAAVSGKTVIELIDNLDQQSKQVVRGEVLKGVGWKSAFLFSGQGSQRVMMGRCLYESDVDYRETFDRGSELIADQEGFDIRSILFNGEVVSKKALDINQTQIAQPALFLLEYCLAQYLIKKGCKPDVLIGHSIGEFAAAAIAGVFSFEDATTLVARRGALMQSMPTGSMLAVKTGSENIADLMTGSLCIAAHNAPLLTGVAGTNKDLKAFEQKLISRDIDSTLLKTSHAFHSDMMQPIVEPFRDAVNKVARHAPNIPIISTATGLTLSAEEAMSSEYWANQLRKTVQFSSAMKTLLNQYSDYSLALLEVGPGSTLLSLAAFQDNLGETVSVPLLPNYGVNRENGMEVLQGLNKLWVKGFPIDWKAHFQSEQMKKVSLPGYAFAAEVHWLDAVEPNSTISPQSSELSQNQLLQEQLLQEQLLQQKNLLLRLTNTAQPGQTQPNVLPETSLNQSTSTKNSSNTIPEVTMSGEQHLQRVQQRLKELFEDVTGYDLMDMALETHFGEVGLDSLLLTQAATAIDGCFDVGLTFRHLVEDYTCLGELSEFIAERVPAEIQETPDTTSVSPSPASQPIVNQQPIGATGNAIHDLIQAQLQVMQMQLAATTLSPTTLSSPNVSSPNVSSPNVSSPNVSSSNLPLTNTPAELDKPVETKGKARHTPGTRITREKVGVTLSQAQKQWIDEVMLNYEKKFSSSKALTQKHRKHLADPRTVSGFNPEWKEIVFPIVTERSKGSKLWDIDGNELIDTANGFGPIFFGHSPDFITDAVKQQLDKGVETGPQSLLAGEVAKLFCELTGNERCTFASTGSEAVMGAIRLARTVTGRSKIVMFEGSYHGIFDEVINRPGRDYQALPAAPGITKEMTHNMLVLPWADDESLDIIRSLGKELAAVLIEPVQSRMPEYHDGEFLKSVRQITEDNKTALILDEVVTGFRVAPGGIGEYFGIDADLTTYGKVVGGGFPIGLIGGKAKFMDALDGGTWQYGDDSIPEVGVTFFAGTFVRHPLSLAAANAVLHKIKELGPSLYTQLADKTQSMATEVKAFISEMKCEVKLEEFASLFYVSVPANAHWGHLLFTMMTYEGINIQQYRPNFLTTEHSEKDIRKIIEAFKNSLAHLVRMGLIEGDSVAAKSYFDQQETPIPPGARLGKNAKGEPAYFVEDPKNKGKYLEVKNLEVKKTEVGKTEVGRP